MFRNKKMLLGITGLLLLGLVIWGCSVNSGSSVGSVPESSDNISYYFPVSEGYTTTYEITTSDGYTATAIFEIGKEVSFKGTTAIEWFVKKDGNIDTSFFEVTNDALYYWDNSTATREKILQLPLDVGCSWDRYETSNQQDDDGTDNGWWGYDDPQNKGDGIDSPDTDIPTNGANKNFPTVGSVTATVVAVERVQLKNGMLFSNAVRVQTTSSQGNHYYWFVPGVGLVKYIIGASDQYDHYGSEAGELVDYGSSR